MKDKILPIVKLWKKKKTFLVLSSVVVIVVIVHLYLLREKVPLRSRWESLSYLNTLPESSARKVLDIDALIQRTSNCGAYFDNTTGLFPILAMDETVQKHLEPPRAFAFMVHKDVGILEVFLALYFRVNNFYVIHVDAKSTKTIHKGVRQVANCYREKFACDNCVFVNNVSLYVDWGQPSVFLAELSNLNALMALKGWQHVSIVAGTELPMMPYANYDQILRDGLAPNESSFESFPLPLNNEKGRMTAQQLASLQNRTDDKRTFLVSSRNTNVTFEATIYKGSRYGVLSRSQVSFLLYHPLAKTFYDWAKGMNMLEESVYSTLLRFQMINGTWEQNVSDHWDTQRGICNRKVNWGNKPCHGSFINGICVLGLDDVVFASTPMQKCLIVNKFGLQVSSKAVFKQFQIVADLSTTYPI